MSYQLIPGVGLVEEQHDGELLPNAFLLKTKPITATLAATESGSDTAAITLELVPVTPEPEVPAAGGVALRDPEIQPVAARLAQFDDRDLLETVPIIMGIINAARR